MRVILATTFVPFVRGGADLIVEWLETMLVRAGHEVEVFRFPFDSNPPDMLEQMLALRLLDVSGRGDRLIAIRTPSYLVRHPNKVLWFIHHHRAAYDLWGTCYGMPADDPEAQGYRDAFRNADNAAFGEAARIFTNSRVVSRRLEEFNGVASEVLYPPLLDAGRYRPGPYGDYFLYVSRMVPHKRQHLAVEAMRHTRTPVRLVVAGAAGSRPYLEELHALAPEGRVEILDRWLAEERKIELIAGSLGGIYCPFDEDSYGYATLEMQHAAKAVVVTSDSGGPLELIEDGVNGLVVEPEPEALAAAMDRLYEDRAEARRMGEAAPARIAALGISWERVLARLLA
ncbi:MAG: glycosyltransferase family 4 protein [Acidobacteriota bacterium]